MDDLIARSIEDFMKAAERAAFSGIQTGTGGNISSRIREKDWMAVKASGKSFRESDADNIIIADFDGNVVQGNMKPTREMVLHSSLYKLFPEMAESFIPTLPTAYPGHLPGQSLPLVTKHAAGKMKCRYRS